MLNREQIPRSGWEFSCSTFYLCCSQVYYWRDSSQLRWLRVNRAMKSQAFPSSNGEPSGVVTGLHPFSNYKMYIVVANNRFEGPPSNNIHFSTPEGGKSLPSNIRDASEATSWRSQASRVLLFSSVFASSTIRSQILQDPTATSRQYLC